MAHTAARCSQCGSRVIESPEDDQFECPFCTATTLLVPADASSAEAKLLQRNQRVDLSKFTIDLEGSDIEVRWDWDRWKGGVLIPIAVVIAWFGWSVFSLGIFGKNNTDWTPLLIGLCVALFAIGVGYSSVALLVNSTRIAIRNRILITSHGPLPYYLRKRIPLVLLEELQVYEKVTTDSDGDTSVEYQLLACNCFGESIPLIVHEKSSATPAAVKSVLDAHISRLSEAAESLEVPMEATTASKQSSRRKVLLICPQCGGLIPPPRKITSSKCRHCGAEIAIEDEVWHSLGLHPPSRRNVEHKPVTFVLHREGSALAISAPWNRTSSLVVLILALCLAAFGVSCLLLLLRSEKWSFVELFEGGSLLVMIPLLFLIVSALGLAYQALCQMFNRTEVKLDAKLLRVWNGPLPRFKSSQLPTAKIAQCSIHHSYGTSIYRDTPCYSLEAISDYGGTLRLFFDQPELKGLETIERLLEHRLRLADRIVEGEV